MRLVISDTGPINYLVLIHQIDILPALFEKIVMPFAVQVELSHPSTPSPVQEWIAHPPIWLEIRELTTHSFEDLLGSLNKGEREAIWLAATLQADTLLLMDDRAAVRAARQKGLAATGTIGVLEEGALRGLVDLNDAFARLRRTNFRYPENVMQELLAKYKEQGRIINFACIPTPEREGAPRAIRPGELSLFL